MSRLQAARLVREAAAEGRDHSIPAVPAAIGLGALFGALLSVLPRLAWSFFGQGMARPVEFGWIRLFVGALEEWGLAPQAPGHYLQMPCDLMIPGGLLRLITAMMLGNSMLAVAAVLLVLWPASLMLGFVPSVATRHAVLASCAIAMGAAPEYLRASTTLFYRHLLPDARWSLAAALSLVTALVAGLAVWFLAFLLLRATGQAGGYFALRRLAALTMLAALGLTGCLLWLQRPATPSFVRHDALSNRPNILLISIDSLRPDHLRCYGYGRRTSPNIDALAAEGARFETAVAPTSWTLPSHVTLLTGLPPESHGVIYDRMRLASAAITLPEVLRAAGYRTVALVSAPYLDASYGYYEGFDYYDDFTVRGAHGGRKAADTAAELWVTSQLLTQQTERTLQNWNQRRQEHPFFLFLHMWDVHWDYIPPPPYDRYFDEDYEGAITGDFDEITAELEPGDLARVVSLYDGEIRLVDEFIGRIVSLLQELEVLDDTVIVITADHGEEFFEHEHAGHRNNLYDETLLVPLLIRYPSKVPAQSVVRGQARLMDVGPTILSLAGVDRPAGFAEFEGAQGEGSIDLTRYLDSQDGAGLQTFAFGDLHGTVASVRTEEFKLISHLQGPKSDELYRLSEDPEERVNVISQEPEVARSLKARLVRWRSRQGIATFAKEISITEEHRRQLRALGYLE